MNYHSVVSKLITTITHTITYYYILLHTIRMTFPYFYTLKKTYFCIAKNDMIPKNQITGSDSRLQEIQDLPALRSHLTQGVGVWALMPGLKP